MIMKIMTMRRVGFDYDVDDNDNDNDSNNDSNDNNENANDNDYYDCFAPEGVERLAECCFHCLDLITIKVILNI